ncbi:MAG: hypothetical protein NVS3B15_18030 [Sediminibacterium sp.]
MRIEMSEQAFSYKELTIANGRGRVPFSFDDIVYIEARNKKVWIITAKEEKLCTWKTLLELEAILPPHLFCRVSRSFIISFKYVTCIYNTTISVKGHLIPITKDFLARFNSHYLHL